MDALATIIYTSGTTGEPKGVMLTHANLVSNMKAGAEALDCHQDDVALSFLPLSHAFERMVAYIYLFCGVTVVFAESFDTIARDIAQVQSDADDRRAARLRETARAIMEKGQPSRRRKRDLPVGRGRGRGAAAARSAAAAALSSDRCRRRSPTVSSSRRSARPSAAGSAISCRAARRCRASIAEFFQGIGLPIIEGYGLTETAPILTVNPPGAPRVGTVGRALPGVELRSPRTARSSRAVRTS